MKIEKSIKMPIRKRAKFPFEKMKVGSSFVITEDMDRNSVQSSARQFVKKYEPEWDFNTRTLENGEIRCFRVK